MSEVVKLPKIRVGARIHTEGWSPSSDLGEFTVIEVLDGWVRCANDQGQLRMFAREHCRAIERGAK